MRAGMKRDAVQIDFLKHTAREVTNNMMDNHKDELQQYLVNAKERKYQLWGSTPHTNDGVIYETAKRFPRLHPKDASFRHRL